MRIDFSSFFTQCNKSLLIQRLDMLFMNPNNYRYCGMKTRICPCCLLVVDFKFYSVWSLFFSSVQNCSFDVFFFFFFPVLTWKLCCRQVWSVNIAHLHRRERLLQRKQAVLLGTPDYSVEFAGRAWNPVSERRKAWIHMYYCWVTCEEMLIAKRLHLTCRYPVRLGEVKSHNTVACYNGNIQWSYRYR